MLYLHFPLCHSERSEESSRQAQFAPLDCHVATFVAPRNDIMVGHPHPIVRSREIPTVTVFPRNDKEKMEYSTCQSGCKIAVLCKNRRCGNCNAHKCALPGATLGFCTSTAQRICTIISSTDKNSCHNFVKLSACWLAFARCFQSLQRFLQVGVSRIQATTLPFTATHYMRARTCTYTHTCDSFIHEL